MSFAHLTGSGSGSAFVLGDKFGYQQAEQIRQNFRALSGLREIMPLGGSRNQGLQHNAVINAYDWLDVEIDSTDLAGLRAVARVECRVDNASTSITPQIYNVTTAAVAGTGSACTATATDFSGTNSIQSIAITLAAGVNKYRLRVTPTNNSFQFFAIGYIEIKFSDDLVLTVQSDGVTITGSSVTLTVSV